MPQLVQKLGFESAANHLELGQMLERGEEGDNHSAGLQERRLREREEGTGQGTARGEKRVRDFRRGTAQLLSGLMMADWAAQG